MGDGHVVTVDLGREITDAARSHLAAAGYRPEVVTGDGARGCPAHAPYDRVIATCAIAAVPMPWLAQCTPGALILAPLATGLIALRVLDATHASGRFLDTPAYIVPLRGATPAPARSPAAVVPAHAERSDSFRFLLAVTGGRVPARAAYGIWHGEGRPTRERYGVTVRGAEQWAWLDTPHESYAWPLGERHRLARRGPGPLFGVGVRI